MVASDVYELFTGKVFLSKESHWARLIVEKSRGSSVSCDYRAIHRRVGLGMTVFVKGLIDNTLAEPLNRLLQMPPLIMAINYRVWKESFYFQGGEIVNGIPEFPTIDLD